MDSSPSVKRSGLQDPDCLLALPRLCLVLWVIAGMKRIIYFHCLRLKFIYLLICYIYFHKVIFYVDGSALGLSHLHFKIIFYKLQQAFLDCSLLLLKVYDE
jgi:hypothetical protein